MGDVRLQVVPVVVYKVDDPGNTRTSSWVFDVALICSDGRDVHPISATLALSSGGSVVERQEWTAEMLATITGTRYRIMPATPVASPRRLFVLSEAFDLHFYVRRPQALSVDAVDLRVVVSDPTGRPSDHALTVPIRYYEQKTALVFPFRGRGHVGQDWATNGGHGGGIFTDFAIDVVGLDERYAPQKDDGDGNASACGWDREVLAPAAGTITYARGDVPDNARSGSPDIDVYSALPDPAMAFVGNCVIVDHGSSEYSVLAHLRHGSVTVAVGDRVVAGQAIGRLGNSGNSFGPHLHYQLLSGPNLFRDPPLPFHFQNVDGPLSRGRYFEAT